MRNEGDHHYFDSLVSEKLGHYVYVLIDPRDEIPFYIGKGGGREGRGNQRLLTHFEEARASNEPNSDKVRKIHEIWGLGHDVSWKIVRHGLPNEDSAFQVECALIDLLRTMSSVANIQSGHGSHEQGLKTPMELKAWAAPSIDPANISDDLRNRPIFLFNIAKGLAERSANSYKNQNDRLIEATCQFWKISPQFKSPEGAIAIGCVNGISRVAFEVAEWKFKEERGRWEITPQEPVLETTVQELTFKNFTSIIQRAQKYWQWGNFIGFQFCGSDEVQIFRGSQDKQPFSLV